jgi:hypothetical protein
MEEKAIRPSHWSMNFGAVIGILMAAFDFISYWSLKNSMSFGAVFSAGTYAALVVGLFVAQKQHRDRHMQGGFIRYDQALKIGALVSIYASIILGFYYYLLCRYDNQMIDKIIETVTPVYEKNGISMQQINETREAITPLSLGLSVIFTYSVIGLMITFITSVFVKKIDTSATGQTE